MREVQDAFAAERVYGYKTAPFSNTSLRNRNSAVRRFSGLGLDPDDTQYPVSS